MHGSENFWWQKPLFLNGFSDFHFVPYMEGDWKDIFQVNSTAIAK